MRQITVLTRILLITIFSISTLGSFARDVKTTEAYENAEWDCMIFRLDHSINYQIVGQKTYSDGSVMLLLTEPAEHVTLKKLNQVFAKYDVSYHVDTLSTRMGYDGWLRDAIICLDKFEGETQKAITSDLFNLLYGTDYKACYLDLNKSFRHPYFHKNLNIHVSSEELKDWFISKEEELTDIERGTITTLPKLLKSEGDEQRLLMSSKSGFVVWLIDKNNLKESEFNIKARKFSLDSDLVLGAIAYGNKVAIIGRERIAPLHVLPPMRTETLKILISTEKKELSQSYERNNIFAGKLQSKWDYAPILLSDELWHTEYGSMLNVTDQMLKSWSENGDIRYDGFKYSHPIDWAFEVGAHRDLEASTLTYNWNTAGAGYVIEATDNDEYSYYAVNRTGSLPVSYIPGSTKNVTETDSIYLAEELAYDFFSNLSSPELVKVVQYVSMYQIFSNFDIHLPLHNTKYDQVVSTDANEKRLYTILDSLTNFKLEDTDFETISERDSAVTQYEKIVYHYGFSKKLVHILSDTEEEKQIYTLYYDSERDRIISEIDSLSHYLSEYKDAYIFKESKLLAALEVLEEGFKDIDSPEFIKRLNAKGTPFLKRVSHYMLNPREMDLMYIISHPDSISDEHYSQWIAYNLTDKNSTILEYAKIQDLARLEDCKDEYVKENVGKSHFWIKCPTIVQSINSTDSINAVGGHNLDSKITPVRIDETLKAGQCRVDVIEGKKVIYVSSADRVRITPDFLRQVERTGYSGVHAFEKPAPTMRAKEDVASLVEPTRTDRCFNEVDHMTISISEESGNLYTTLHGERIEGTDDVIRIVQEYANNKADKNPKHITFEIESEDMVHAIIDRTNTMLTRGDVTKIQNSSHLIDKTKLKKQKDGYTYVLVPIENSTIQAKSSTHGFKVPTSKANAFVEALKEYFLESPSKIFNRLHLLRKLKKSNIGQDEIQEFLEYNNVALIFDGNINRIYDVEYI